MRIEKQPAYVLHARPYRETSWLLECLTRDFGRLGVVVRGVRGGRRAWMRAQLDLFQPLGVDLFLRGELATLRKVDLLEHTRRLQGEVVLAGLYLNELVMRLTERQDPLPSLFAIYRRTLDRLRRRDRVAWTLRRCERDLLQTLGYGLQLERELNSGHPLVPEGRYRYHVEQGPLRVGEDTPRSVRGSDLLDLGADQSPDLAGLVALRDMMREVLQFHLGGTRLRAWSMFSATLGAKYPSS